MCHETHDRLFLVHSGLSGFFQARPLWSMKGGWEKEMGEEVKGRCRQGWLQQQHGIPVQNTGTTMRYRYAYRYDFPYRYTPLREISVPHGHLSATCAHRSDSPQSSQGSPWQLRLERLPSGEEEPPVSLAALLQGLLADFASSPVSCGLYLSKWEFEVDSFAFFGSLLCLFVRSLVSPYARVWGQHIKNTPDPFNISWWARNRILACKSPRFLVPPAASERSADFESGLPLRAVGLVNHSYDIKDKFCDPVAVSWCWNMNCHNRWRLMVQFFCGGVGMRSVLTDSTDLKRPVQASK